MHGRDDAVTNLGLDFAMFVPDLHNLLIFAPEHNHLQFVNQRFNHKTRIEKLPSLPIFREISRFLIK